MCRSCFYALVVLDYRRNLYVVAFHIITSGNHFHVFMNAGLRNTDDVPTPPYGVPTS